jgi:hypothetical protein
MTTFRSGKLALSHQQRSCDISLVAIDGASLDPQYTIPVSAVRIQMALSHWPWL